MVQADPGRVIRLRPSAAAARRARQQVRTLLESAIADLQAALDGEGEDLGHVHDGFVAVARAVRLVVDHGLDLDQQEVAS